MLVDQLLLGSRLFARYRWHFVLLLALSFTAIGVAPIYFDWIPKPAGSSTVGFWCGVVAAGIILFEMLLWARKRWRLLQRCIATRYWLWLHVWLGLLSLPLVLIHCGGLFGGTLSSLLLALFLVVIASGVWGLCMQQVVPEKLLNEIEEETVRNAIDDLMQQRLREAEAVLVPYFAERDQQSRSGGAGVQAPTRARYRVLQLVQLFEANIRPYLQGGRWANRLLASPARARQLFTDLRGDAEDDFLTAVAKLEESCRVRRQLDQQIRLNWWLHVWLLFHTPLSLALTLLLPYHVVVALKYW